MGRELKIHIKLLVVWMGLGVVGAVPIESEDHALNFIVLHNNDLHGRFEESTIKRTDCQPDEALNKKCYGGFARISTLVKQYRSDQEKDNGTPVLYLNAGDTFVGTPYFYVFRDKITSEFMNVLKPDCGALGNHEFDFGVGGLLPFLQNINFPIAATNLNISTDHPLWQTHALRRSAVFNINDTKVGVIGYILPETQSLSKTDDVGILPEIEAINQEAENLKRKGVNILIALGHSGYEKDQEIARECPLIDVVVGAHSHSFLYTGTPPDADDKPVGPYPTIIKQKSGKEVPVVQAYAYSKYLGKLELSFDKNGNLLHWAGAPILLDYRIPRDPEILDLLAKYRPTIERLTKDMIGYSKVDLEQKCFNFECNIGNLFTDAWIYARVLQYSGHGWTDAPIAFINAGAIRSSAAIGGISKFTLSTIMPFNNSLMIVHVPGSVIKTALEHAVKEYVVGGYMRQFLQMSGARVLYDMKNKPGQRVRSVETVCDNCSVPEYAPLDERKTYGVIIESFIYNGGDGFTMFKPFEALNMNITSLEAVSTYVQRFEAIYPGLEGRVKVIGLTSAAPTINSFNIFAPIIVAFSLLNQFS